ncbi:MAG: hypothetical protein EOO03_16220 [Chitinophagaceae bacterium]|nr:MAG: hypothetical protein EOO03_16220 [Chitinophagaceae bacterium]
MKKLLLMAAVVYSGNLLAQQKLVTQAIVNTTTTVVAPSDEEDVSSIQTQGEGRISFRNFADGETKSVTYLKNDLVKTVTKNDMGRTTAIRDNAKKVTTTLMEMMGNKTGVYATDEDQANMRKRVDSMMQATRNSADTSTRRMARPQDVPTEIAYTEETKKIAGYTCKKAYVVSTRFLGIKDSAIAWYAPEIKLQNISSTGGLSGFGNFGGSSSTSALSKIDGFVMRYETKMGRGRTMTTEVTKLDLAKEVADKEFEIPKDFDVKPMKDMQNNVQFSGGSVPGRTIIRMN